MIGIYCIENKTNGKRYIGKTVDSQERFVRHRTLLKHNNHYNIHLQNSYNKHGKENFTYSIIEECCDEPAILAQREQFWIDHYDPKTLYNINLCVEYLYGERNPFYGKKHSDISRAKISASKQGGVLDGEKNPNFGNKWSETQRLNGITNQPNRKLDPAQVLEIRKLLANGEKHQSIADKYFVTRTVITRINSGARWSLVKE